ncbi:dTDP-4-dehydrorhamnose 3,5-epimerase family protein [Tessaracoccus oleiagri]|uniref:dTDP-4-dehydrorhamnose 3,5-epimerase n=1 Tax=Tessaracoccus oleiagri TaxID=686624 RepID=A0A1G9N6A7_9ACTN|nr:dTDP-4-dehydrorhamnose 3,5-epimerase family protein [Tessaracoccus oleiagri]SDL81913.1 dTDP-4-dehydrorhamnose 3,5-epimerase [Tessaracoccus oleiagri]
MAELSIRPTDIPGLLVIHLGLQPNDDGWFKEGWHRAKMTSLGLPDFDPVQYNVTHVVNRGTTRGFLAEPWDRIVGMERGRAFGAWVDLREGEHFGRTFTVELHPGIAVFVPRGVATAHQTLEDDSTYTYLLEQHWTPEGRSRAGAVDLFDPALGIEWPIPRARAVVAHRDTLNPPLALATPMAPRRTLVAGTETPLGRAILAELPHADGITTAELAPRAASSVDLSAYDVLLSAHGDVATGTPDSPQRPDPWHQAAERFQRLADVARRHRMRLVHLTSDPIFERAAPIHGDDAVLSMDSARGRALAAGELIASTVPRALIIRTGWVMGRTESFVEHMAVAARRGTSPTVIRDRHGRLTFADQLVAAINHLLDLGAATGTYNVTGDGKIVSWFDVAQRVFQLSGADTSLVRGVPAPEDDDPGDGGVLALDRLKEAGFRPGNAWLQIADHLPRPAEQPRPLDVSAAATMGGSEVGRTKPFKVLFVCTANICRSAYADVVARGRAVPGLEFSSAGTHALVGEGIDPPMAGHVSSGDTSAHQARQLTRDLVTDTDLILTMAADHRRWILDEWPMLGRKAFVIGHAARVLAQLPPEVTLEGLVDYLWSHRSSEVGDDVADPYRRGPEAAATAARQIDANLDVIVDSLERLGAKKEEHR